MNAARCISMLFSRLSIQTTAPRRGVTALSCLSSPILSRDLSVQRLPSLPVPSLLAPSFLPTTQTVRTRYFEKIKGDRHDGLIYDPLLERLHAAGPPKPRRKKKHPLDSKPFMKGVVIKTLVKKPKKPNSANRKCVLVRLSNGKEATAYIPGVGHNLQEHSVVLVYRARTKDVPGLKLKVVRGKYDCAHVIRRPQAGS